jgi:hypothetical protein
MKTLFHGASFIFCYFSFCVHFTPKVKASSSISYRFTKIQCFLRHSETPTPTMTTTGVFPTDTEVISQQGNGDKEGVLQPGL